MRRIAAGLFSFLLAYAGAAHALEACLTHDHADHELESHHSHSGVAANHGDSQGPTSPVIHCAAAEKRLGPAVQVSVPKLSRLSAASLAHSTVLPATAFFPFGNGLWLEALFRKGFAFLPTDLARYLFLSVLQI